MEGQKSESLLLCEHCNKTAADCSCKIAERKSEAGRETQAAPAGATLPFEEALQVPESRLRVSQQENDSLPSFDPWIGKNINEQYEIVALIARGGMGAVYKARHLLLNQYRAIKVIRHDLHRDDVVYQRFRKEAQAVSGLSHQNIVSFYDYGIWESAPYVVMDLVEGESLDSLLKSRGRLDINEVLSIFAQVSEALAHAHSKGIFHRDIKPSNIMLVKSDDGSLSAKVLDFGIAKIQSSEDGHKLTSTGEIFGTPAYMSPEQGKGQIVDERSDIYSLACVMYEALSGQVPFEGRNPIETIMKHLNERPPKLLDPRRSINQEMPAFPPFRGSSPAQTAIKWLNQKIPGLIKAGTVDDPVLKDMEAIINRCLEKDPANRYQKMDALKEDLKKLSYGERLLLLQEEISTRKRLKFISKAYNYSLIAAAVLLIPLSYYWVFVDPDSWRQELHIALQDPDNADKKIQQLIVDLPQFDAYHRNRAMLLWNQAQVLRMKSWQHPTLLGFAKLRYQQAYDDLRKFRKSNNPSKSSLSEISIKGNCLSGLAMCYLQEMSRDQDLAKKAAEAKRILKEGIRVEPRQNEVLAAIYSAEDSVKIQRQLFELENHNRESSHELADALQTLARCYLPLGEFEKIDQMLEEQERLLRPFPKEKWSLVDCLTNRAEIKAYLAANTSNRVRKTELRYDAIHELDEAMTYQSELYGKKDPHVLEIQRRIDEIKKLSKS